MRSKEQIERDVERARQKADVLPDEAQVDLACIQTDVLLDIRDLLIEQKKRTDPTTYR